MLNVAVVSQCENKNQPVVGIQNMDNNNVFVISPTICIDNAGHICQLSNPPESFTGSTFFLCLLTIQKQNILYYTDLSTNLFVLLENFKEGTDEVRRYLEH